MKIPVYEFRQYEAEESDVTCSCFCPECQCEHPMDFPDDHYIIVKEKGFNVIKNYWIKDDKEEGSWKPDDDLIKKIKDKIYPVISNGTQNRDGGQDWKELHCCPVHGEFSVNNGYP